MGMFHMHVSEKQSNKRMMALKLVKLDLLYATSQFRVATCDQKLEVVDKVHKSGIVQLFQKVAELRNPQIVFLCVEKLEL